MRNVRKFGIIGAANGLGGHVLGAEKGPQFLRDLGVVKSLTDLGVEVLDLGDIKSSNTPETKKSHKRINNYAENKLFLDRLYEATLKAYTDELFPIILGGDHSLSIATVSAAYYFLQKKLSRDPIIGVLWVDAHADLNTDSSTLSGNLHGMSIASLLGDGDKTLGSIGCDKPKIFKDKIVYLGLRDLDRYEKEIIKERGIAAHTMADVDHYGIGEITERSLKQLRDNCDAIIVSFDLDACDPKLAPGVGTAVRGGLTFREAHYVIERAVEEPKLISFELVELNPDCDMDNQTADLAKSLLESAVGKTIL